MSVGRVRRPERSGEAWVWGCLAERGCKRTTASFARRGRCALANDARRGGEARSVLVPLAARWRLRTAVGGVLAGLGKINLQVFNFHIIICRARACIRSCRAAGQPVLWQQKRLPTTARHRQHWHAPRHLALLVQAAVANDADVATQKCLDDETSNARRARRAGSGRACLVAVPFGRSRWRQVLLRCCLKYWLKEYGLDRGGRLPGGTGRRRAHRRHLLGGTLKHGPSGRRPRRRVSRDKMPWVSERWTAEERAVEAARRRAAAGASVAVTDRDRSATDEFLWDRKRTVSANGHAGIGRWSAKDAWLELHFGDNCGDFYRGNAFGTYMGLSLASLLRYFLPEVVGNRSLTLVTSSDCNVPLRPGKTPPFLDMNDLLETVNLKAWYANNPSDGLIDSVGEIARPHPKMKAYATGVRDPATWVEALDGREAFGDRTGPLVCCCMSMLATPQKADQYQAPREYASPSARVRERAKRVFDHDRS